MAGLGVDERREQGWCAMKIVVDWDKCEGHGMCEAMAPGYFELDDDDSLTVLDDAPPESARSHVSAAAQSCPALALSIEG